MHALRRKYVTCEDCHDRSNSILASLDRIENKIDQQAGEPEKPPKGQT